MDWTVYFVTNACIGILTALAAKAKGRPMMPWFLTTLVFSVLALLAVLIAPGAGKKCPKCAETVRKDASVCKHCGHEFSVEVEPTPVPQA